MPANPRQRRAERLSATAGTGATARPAPARTLRRTTIGRQLAYTASCSPSRTMLIKQPLQWDALQWEAVVAVAELVVAAQGRPRHLRSVRIRQFIQSLWFSTLLGVFRYREAQSLPTFGHSAMVFHSRLVLPCPVCTQMLV